MIIREKVEEYDGSFRLVMFESDGSGGYEPTSRKSDLDDQIASFYEQRRAELERLKKDLLAKRSSPIALYMTYQNLTVSDLSSRVRLRSWRVKKHLTYEGFRNVTVEVLQRYARVFNITVADFFQFLKICDDSEIKSEVKNDRLVQLLEITNPCKDG